MAKKEDIQEDGIVVRDPQDLRPKSLPLVVTLPADASLAQVEFAKVLNGYAYSQPDKWMIEKDDRTHTDEFSRTAVIKGLLTQLRELKNAPDPVANPHGVQFPNKLATE